MAALNLMQSTYTYIFVADFMGQNEIVTINSILPANGPDLHGGRQIARSRVLTEYEGRRIFTTFVYVRLLHTRGTYTPYDIHRGAYTTGRVARFCP